jgi:putative acetyltransferase
VQVRVETPEDRRAVEEVTTAAFGRATEARMIEAIRASDGFVPELSLVAVDRDEVVGHVLLSYVGLEGSDRRLLELGPISVRPDRQRTGIGSALVRPPAFAEDD